ncbi:MAG TPA: RagB/SusD family nutrient uptake outer membrane protein, partial [Pedobacter sp.]
MKIYPHKINASCFACFIILLFFTGCKKAIDTGLPVTQLSSAYVFTSNGTAEGAISGILTSMSNINSIYNGSSGISVQQALAADEVVNYSPGLLVANQFYTNSLNSQGIYYWTTMYSQLYSCNAAIQGLTQTTQLTPAIRQQLLGEAEFIRAYIYFYAVNLYGDVPLALTTDYTV